LKLPNKLRLFGRTFKVSNNDIKCALLHCEGYIDMAAQEIGFKEVGDAYTEENQADTVLHELLHAVFKYSDIQLEAEDEEHVVTVVATSLVQIIRDNKLDFLDRT
jgi:hypothetical protein